MHSSHRAKGSRSNARASVSSGPQNSLRQLLCYLWFLLRNSEVVCPWPLLRGLVVRTQAHTLNQSPNSSH